MKTRADKQDWQVEAIRKGIQQADAGKFASRASVERLLRRGSIQKSVAKKFKEEDFGRPVGKEVW